MCDILNDFSSKHTSKPGCEVARLRELLLVHDMGWMLGVNSMFGFGPN
jgi:hypothetical protein